VSAARRAARERRAVEGAATLSASDQPSSGVDEESRILHEEVARLPEKYRAAVVLCYFEGLTHAQAAESLRWPVGTVHGYLSGARGLWRARLIRRGLAPAVAAGVLVHPSPSAANPGADPGGCNRRRHLEGPDPAVDRRPGPVDDAGPVHRAGSAGPG